MTLNGLDSASFRQDLDALFMLYQYMERHFVSGSLAHWLPKRDTIVLSSRVLTEAKHAESMPSETIPHALDPREVLRKSAEQNGFRYLEDNVVEFSHLVQDK